MNLINYALWLDVCEHEAWRENHEIIRIFRPYSTFETRLIYNLARTDRNPGSKVDICHSKALKTAIKHRPSFLSVFPACTGKSQTSKSGSPRIFQHLYCNFTRFKHYTNSNTCVHVKKLALINWSKNNPENIKHWI